MPPACSYSVSLQPGDLAQLQIEAGGRGLEAFVRDREGAEIRSARLNAGPNLLYFVARTDGSHTLTVRAAGSAPATCAVTVKGIVKAGTQEPAGAQQRPLPPILESLLRKTRGREEAGGFWREVARQGTPLFESIPGDARNMLCTFL